jgi:N-acetylglucosaminyldiphosphoundecaprenol N-acetyl-beta-D-mannosaminyltransferase
MLVAGVGDPQYRSLFMQADLCLPDATGLILASGGKIRHRVPGADIAKWLLTFCEHKNFSVTIIIWENGFSTAEEVKEAVKRIAPNLRVTVLSAEGSVMEAKGLVKKISSDVVLVGLGFPRQEYWINTAKELVKTPKIWMTIGGTVDYWTGKKPRAPKWMRGLGLEWLWRLVIQPTRMMRIFRALFVFPWYAYVLKNKPLYSKT